MELLNFAGLLLIAGTNAWIALETRKAKSEKPAPRPISLSDQIYTGVSNAFNNFPTPEPINYDKLEQAIRKGIIRAEIQAYNAKLGEDV